MLHPAMFCCKCHRQWDGWMQACWMSVVKYFNKYQMHSTEVEVEIIWSPKWKQISHKWNIFRLQSRSKCACADKGKKIPFNLNIFFDEKFWSPNGNKSAKNRIFFITKHKEMSPADKCKKIPFNSNIFFLAKFWSPKWKQISCKLNIFRQICSCWQM